MEGANFRRGPKREEALVSGGRGRSPLEGLRVIPQQLLRGGAPKS